MRYIFGLNMNCKECPFNNKKKCTATGGGISRKCANGSMKWNFGRIDMQSDWKVLDVGCGGRKGEYFKKIIEKNGVKWFGIDPKKGIRTHEGIAQNIPFKNEYFDMVYSNASMEHWVDPEYPSKEHPNRKSDQYRSKFGGKCIPCVTFEWVQKGLQEIYRVLKKDGYLVVGFPMAYEGPIFFVEEDIETIKKLFEKNLWYNVDFQEWRRDLNKIWRMVVICRRK